MTRLPYAAKVLMDQVEEAKPRSRSETVGDPDGLGVYRTIRFSKSAGKWLAPLLETIEDERIESFDLDDDGLVVTFVHTPNADSRTPFPLDAAIEVRRR